MKDSLEFFTSKELIEELFNRPNFVGMLIFSNDEHRKDYQIHNSYSTIGTIPMNEIPNLLETIISKIKLN